MARIILVLVASALWNGMALADSNDVIVKRGDVTYTYKKTNQYDFDGISIDGDSHKPVGSVISPLKAPKGKSLLPMRPNFDAEVIDSARLGT